MSFLYLIAILGVVSGILALVAWIFERKKPNPWANRAYEGRWPKPKGFRGY